ncbi:MAG: NAD(P)-dependent glycerol-3-phosphate dehydrogenase [Magnetococcales bacterium]|nr:NAD(P)-dependent glycerol-3-phosphate dehydrogenase [Magnetococcales bacterium]
MADHVFIHPEPSVAVIGAGSWGTALAALLAGKLSRVTLWCREAEVAESINGERRNPLFMADVWLPATLRAVTDLEAATAAHTVLVMAVPTQFTRAILERMAPHWPREGIAVFATKGIEMDRLTLISELCREVLGAERVGRSCYLSGPSFAREVLAGLPTAVAVAGQDPRVVQTVQELFATAAFRTYSTDDVTGVELGGALKNVIALAAGIGDGLGYGHNARAALITRGLAEMIRLGESLGARRETFAGLSGLGDLLLTATSEQSRNRMVGFQLGQGRSLADIQAGMQGQVAEGVKTAHGVFHLAQRQGIDMPITRAVYAILFQDRPPASVVRELMERALKPESA